MDTTALFVVDAAVGAARSSFAQDAIGGNGKALSFLIVSGCGGSRTDNGAATAAWRQTSDSDLLDVTDVRAVETAVGSFLPEIELTALDAQDRTHDPFAGETWVMFGLGQMSTFGEEFYKPDGRVRIAGGDYALGWAGHTDGAIESGKCAALGALHAVSTHLE